MKYSYYFITLFIFCSINCINSLKLSIINKNIRKALSISLVTILPLISNSPILVNAVEIPTDKDNQLAAMAFRDFNLKRFDASEKEFSTSILRWKEMERPRDEIVSLLKGI